MDSIGMIRKIDELGRVVLPSETRKMLDINVRDELEVLIDEDKIVLKKYRKACIICDSKEHIMKIDDKLICKKCIRKISGYKA